MADGGFEAFFAAIGGQESGGNYGAVNSSTGATGKYQIMPANIGPWSRQYLGYNITVDQFRNSPALQEKLARAVLSSYYNLYGARGAAAAWYSGNPGRANDYGSVGNGPPVGSYVDQVLVRMRGGAPAPNGAPNVPQTEARPAIQNDGVPQMFQGLEQHSTPGLGLASTPGLQQASTPGLTTTPGKTGAAPVPAQQINSTIAAGPRPGESASEFRDRIISSAMRFIGTPYVWGGTSPKGFDCSGLIQYVYGKLGYSLPRISADQANNGRHVGINDLRAGDLVAWDEGSRNMGADHIAIYAGNGYIIESPHTGASVRYRKLGANENAWGVALDLPGD